MDDGISIEYNYEEAKRKSEIVQETLTKSGFIPNIEKSTWKPCKIVTWLGIDINLLSGTLKITKSRIDNILNTISLILRKIFVSARILAKLAGQLISTKYVIGDIVRLKTRFLYKSIEQSSSWDKTFNIGNYNDTVDEILFWKFNPVKYNNKVINCYNIPLFHVHSHASNTGISCVFDVRGKKNICYRNLTDLEKTFGSTWRELEAIRFSLLSSIKQFENKCIFWYTDNFATQQIITCGSNKTHIHLLALNIFSLTFDHNIHLEVFWFGREYIKEADKISKTIYFGDWYTTQHLINILEQRWGKYPLIDLPQISIGNLKDLIRAGRQQEINFRFTRLPRLFYCNFNDKIMTKKKERKEKNIILSL